MTTAAHDCRGVYFVLQDSQSPIAALPTLLGILHTTEQLGLWDVHRQCSVRLSSTLLQIDRNVEPNLADPSRGKSEGQACLLTVATNDIEPIWDKVSLLRISPVLQKLNYPPKCRSWRPKMTSPFTLELMS